MNDAWIECKNFIDFKNNTRPEDYGQHIHYLYSFIKFIFNNVKRPFALYEDCLKMINSVHIDDYKYINNY